MVFLLLIIQKLNVLLADFLMIKLCVSIFAANKDDPVEEVATVKKGVDLY
jgi:hypothetical protein